MMLAAGALSGHAEPVNSESRFDCLIEPLTVIELGSPVQGIIESVGVRESDRIERGQVLATLDSSVERAAMDQAKARAAMTGEIESRRAELELARQSKARIDELFEKSMASKQQRDEAHAKVRVAEMALQQARDRQVIAQYDYRWAAEVLNRRTVRSPISGVVVEVLAHPGEFVYENPIMTIAQVDPLRVDVILPIELYGSLEPGAHGVVYPEVGSEEHYASVSVVESIMDPGSSTFSATLELPNTGLLIPGGQRCEIAFLPAKGLDPDALALASGSGPRLQRSEDAAGMPEVEQP
jgi:RND family efflux transporter MFP subunit